MSEAAWGFLGGLVLSAVTAAGNILIKRGEGKTAIQVARPDLITAQGEEIGKLWRRLDEREKAHDEEAQRLERDLDTERRKNQELERRVQRLEDQLQAYRDLIAAHERTIAQLRGDVQQVKDHQNGVQQ